MPSELISQLDKLPQVWIPVLVLLVIAGISVWRFALSFHEERDKAHQAREAVTLGKLALLEAQLAELQRSKNNSHMPLYDPTTVLSYTDFADDFIDQSDKPEPVFLPTSASPQFLVNLTKGQTDFQGAIRVKPYIGKWIRLSGTLVEVLDPKGRPEITIYVRSESMGEPILPGLITSDVIAVFDNYLDSLTVAQIGDPIRLKGEIQRIEMDAVMLRACILE